MKKVTGIIRKGEKYFIGECVEIDVVTQGKTIDETLRKLKEAIALYFKDEEIEDFALSDEPSITIPIEIEEYAKL